MRLEKLIILILITTLLSCGKKSNNAKHEPVNEITEAKIEDYSKPKEEKTPITESLTKPIVNDNIIRLKFEEFELQIGNISVWDEEEKLKQTQKDTARIYLELGETIEAQSIKINKLKDGDLKIYQRFENSITVMDEGPHCDLTEWKHYDSEWNELGIKNGEFLTNSYTENDWAKFIEVNMNDLKEAVRKQCGDRWAKLIIDAQSPTEYPLGVSTSRIFLKIEFSDYKENTTTEKFISFEIPMGC